MHGAAMVSGTPFALRRTRVGVEVKMLRDEEDTDRKISEGEEGEAFFWCEALHARVNCRESSLLTLSFAKRIENQPITSSLFRCVCEMDLKDHQFQCGLLMRILCHGISVLNLHMIVEGAFAFPPSPKR
jgi:hypothetical protein